MSYFAYICVLTYDLFNTNITHLERTQQVPVVTLRGSNHAHNVGVSFLSRIKGLKSLIASTEQEYVSIAVSLAKDIPRLKALRASIRTSMRASSLCDGATFTRHLEGAFCGVWKEYCKTHQPPLKSSIRESQSAYGHGSSSVRNINDYPMTDTHGNIPQSPSARKPIHSEVKVHAHAHTHSKTCNNNKSTTTPNMKSLKTRTTRGGTRPRSRKYTRAKKKKKHY